MEKDGRSRVGIVIPYSQWSHVFILHDLIIDKLLVSTYIASGQDYMLYGDVKHSLIPSRVSLVPIIPLIFKPRDSLMGYIWGPLDKSVGPNIAEL